MNKRTKEIAEQSYEQQPLMVVNPQTYEPEHKIGNGGVPMYHRVFNQEKFAELLVKECDRYVAEHYDECEPWMEPGDLLKHFGVE